MERDIHQHIGEERLEAYAMQSMRQEEAAAVEEHLLFCSTCLDQLEAVEHHVRAMRAAANRIRTEERQAPVKPGVLDWLRSCFRPRVPIWTGALAATLAIVGLLAVVGRRAGEHPGLPVDVELHAVRGVSVGTAPSGHALHLLLDGRGLPGTGILRVEIVDEDGSKVWSGTAPWSDSMMVVSVDRSFRSGTYFVRLLKEGEDPLREYQLLIHKEVEKEAPKQRP